MPTMNQFSRIYQKLGLRKKIHFTQCCQNASECWKTIPKPSWEDDYNSIYAPYIGPKYHKSRLVVIAENMFEYGGWGSVDELVKEAKNELPIRTRVRFGNEFKDYAGSFLWLWLGAYGAAYADYIKMTSCTWQSGMPTIPDIINGFDFLAYTNHVKCSPSGDRAKRGRPTSEMWHRCGVHILREELIVLKPSTLIVMGKDWNSWAFQEHVFDENTDLKSNGTSLCGTAMLNGELVKTIVMPHPSWYGKARKVIMGDFRSSLIALDKA